MSNVKPRILFVDDEQKARELFENALREQPFTVDLASSAKQATLLAEAAEYALVATDERLKNGSGLDVIRTLRSLQPDAAFLLMTGSSHLDLGREGDTRHISEVVYKPWSSEELVAIVRRALEQRRAAVATRRVEQLSRRSFDSKYRVLMLEDDDADGMLIEAMLRRSAIGSFEVSRAARLDEGIEILRRQTFDLALVDLSLPDARGLSAVAMLHAEAGDVPLVVVSGHSDPAVALQAVRIGAQDFVVKGHVEPSQLARTIQFAIERHRAKVQLEIGAHYNDLTGLPNRRFFRDRLERAVKRSARSGRLMALLNLDLDGFKLINDTYGHPAGDSVLSEMGRRLEQSCRSVDTAAHLSGDEFAVILEDISSTDEAGRVAERIIRAIAEPIAIAAAGTARITASIGIAFHRDGEDSQALIYEADQQMYAAKRAGRNRVSKTEIVAASRPAGSH